MNFKETNLEGVWIIEPEKFSDERGFLAPMWSKDEFAARGLDARISGSNVSRNRIKGTLRGMHYQLAPYAQSKLVRCTRGAVYDVAIDLRPDSRTFRQWTAVELTECNHLSFYIPEGFAHGYLTLLDESEVVYQLGEAFAPDHARGVRWNDPAFHIEWPIAPLLMNERDRQYPDFNIYDGFLGDMKSNFERVLVVAPHPDDEILGCGGTLLRRKAEGAKIGWLIITRGISGDMDSDAARVCSREAEISAVASAVGFDEVFNLRLAASLLDTLRTIDLVDRISAVFKSFQPHEVFLPHYSDIHSDHGIVFDAATACTKWFRHPTIHRVLAYETLSETEFGARASEFFQPNHFVDISPYLEAKLASIQIYKSELGEFPFPRSVEAIRALAVLRGAAAGYAAAEAFQLVRERC